jgi:hypothetical protein
MQTKTKHALLYFDNTRKHKPEINTTKEIPQKATTNRILHI